jgi:hypothetical protein
MATEAVRRPEVLVCGPQWIWQFAEHCYQACDMSLLRRPSAQCAGDETRPIIMATQRAGPDQGYQATQKGARLVIRLLQAYVPLAAHFMAAFKAASHLVTKLEVCCCAYISQRQATCVPRHATKSRVLCTSNILCRSPA